MYDTDRLPDRLETWGFANPDQIGSSEYSAIYECLTDALIDQDNHAPDDSPTDLIKSILKEFRDTARTMLKDLKANRQLQVREWGGSK